MDIQKQKAIEQIKKDKLKARFMMFMAGLCLGASIANFAAVGHYGIVDQNKFEDEKSAIIEKFEQNAEYVAFKEEKIANLDTAIKQGLITEKGYNAEIDQINSDEYIMSKMEDFSPETYAEYNQIKQENDKESAKAVGNLVVSLLSGAAGLGVLAFGNNYYLDYKKRKDNFVEFYHEHYDSEMNK